VLSPSVLRVLSPFRGDWITVFPMTQPPQSASPLTARLYDLEYPRSLGVYSTYQEVQSVVDTLADNHFEVQSTLIVGTDLKLMERVTGRKTWGRVVGQGILSGLWMGLFLGLLLMLITPGSVMIVVTSVLMGMVFFTVWAVIGYAMSGGKRDFTSMTATIPMQYELLVEHKHADHARRILAETGVSAAPVPQAPGTPLPGHRGPGGAPAGYGQSPQQAPPPAPHRPFGQEPVPPQQAPVQPAPQHGRPAYGQPASTPAAPSTESARPARPSFGQPAGTPRSDGARPSSAPQPPAHAPTAPRPGADDSGERRGPDDSSR
jgi:hypothetical protein